MDKDTEAEFKNKLNKKRKRKKTEPKAGKIYNINEIRNTYKNINKQPIH